MDLKPPPGRIPNLNHWMMDGLVGWWPLWEGAGGRVFDISGEGNTGSFQGDQVWTIGQQRDRIKNTNGYIDIPGTGANTPDEITLSLRVTFRSVSGTQILAANRQGNVEASGAVIFLSSSTIQFWATNTAVLTWETQLSADGTASVGVEYHIVGTFRNGRSRLYINGKQQSSTDTDAGPLAWVASRNWRLGSDDTPANDSVADYDDFRIFSRAFSASEVQQLYFDPWVPFRRDIIVPGTSTLVRKLVRRRL